MYGKCFRDLQGEVEIHIDDIACFRDNWEKHMLLLHQVCSRLQDDGFTVNPLKCEWGVQETACLGYLLTPVGSKPWKKDIKAVIEIEPPKNVKQLRGVIGVVNYCRDMWPKRAHALAPLTGAVDKYRDKNKKIKFKWEQEMEKAFKQMKLLLATDAMTYYPNHNKPFKIYTDASDYQTEACIMQEHSGKFRPVAYYSRKLHKAQRIYTVPKKELLAIVATFKECRSMVLGVDLTVHTDHKVLCFENLQTQRVLKWRLFLEEYSPKFEYINGESNVTADTF